MCGLKRFSSPAWRKFGSGGRILAVGLAIGASACAPRPSPYPDLPRLAVWTQFGERNLCGLGISPAVTIGNAPSGVATYRVKITNIDALLHTPWEATVPASAGGIVEGAARDYEAPCPGEFQTHRYRLEVLALERSGRPIGYGSSLTVAQSLAVLVRTRSGAALPEPSAPAPRPAPQDSPLDFLTGRDRDRGTLPPIIGPDYGR